MVRCSETLCDQFYTVCTDLTDGMTCSVDGGKFTLTNITGCSAVFDIDADTIHTANLENFTCTAYTLQVLMSAESTIHPDATKLFKISNTAYNGKIYMI